VNQLSLLHLRVRRPATSALPTLTLPWFKTTLPYDCRALPPVKRATSMPSTTPTHRRTLLRALRTAPTRRSAGEPCGGACSACARRTPSAAYCCRLGWWTDGNAAGYDAKTTGLQTMLPLITSTKPSRTHYTLCHHLTCPTLLAAPHMPPLALGLRWQPWFTSTYNCAATTYLHGTAYTVPGAPRVYRKRHNSQPHKTVHTRRLRTYIVQHHIRHEHEL